MQDELALTSPAAFTIKGATDYSGFTRTFLYENRRRLDWIKAGRRSLITRESLDRLLLQLLLETRAAARPSAGAVSMSAPEPTAKKNKGNPRSSVDSDPLPRRTGGVR
jgi:hypothetical protein